MRILSDTRSEKDTLDVFGGEYPGGALYTRADWIEKNPKLAQGMTTAIVNTLKWLHSHTPEEIMAKMPEQMVGKNKELYLAALKNTIPMYGLVCTPNTSARTTTRKSPALTVVSQMPKRVIGLRAWRNRDVGIVYGPPGPWHHRAHPGSIGN